MLNKYLAKNTFSINNTSGSLITLSFVWEGAFVNLLWNDLTKEIEYTNLDDELFDMSSLTEFVNENLFEMSLDKDVL